MSHRNLSFDGVLAFFQRHQIHIPDTLFLVAYSGGVDSHVLLHVMSELNTQELGSVCAVYIDHGLQDSSSLWAEHCAKVCQSLNVDYITRQVQVGSGNRISLEAAAREARYGALIDMAHEQKERFCKKQVVILTAQHQDDQAETLFLQLLRGAGGKGLAGMPVCKALCPSIMQMRPLLKCAKQSILEYAHAHGLAWVNDPSNASDDFDRNYLRNQIMPQLKERFGDVGVTFSRSAHLLAEQNQLTAELLDSYKLARGLTTTQPTLPLLRIKTQSDQLQRALIRDWLSNQCTWLPSYKVLEQIRALMNLRSDKQGEVSWGRAPHQVAVRFYDDALWFLNLESERALEQAFARLFCDGVELDVNNLPHSIQVGSGIWNVSSKGQNPVRTGCQNSSHQVAFELLITKEKLECALKKRVQSGDRVRIVFNLSNATKVYLSHKTHGTRLKQYFQSLKIPPWRRPYYPLIVVNDIVTGFFKPSDFNINMGV